MVTKEQRADAAARLTRALVLRADEGRRWTIEGGAAADGALERGAFAICAATARPVVRNGEPVLYRIDQLVAEDALVRAKFDLAADVANDLFGRLQLKIDQDEAERAR